MANATLNTLTPAGVIAQGFSSEFIQVPKAIVTAGCMFSAYV